MKKKEEKVEEEKKNLRTKESEWQLGDGEGREELREEICEYVFEVTS